MTVDTDENFVFVMDGTHYFESLFDAVKFVKGFEECDKTEYTIKKEGKRTVVEYRFIVRFNPLIILRAITENKKEKEKLNET